MPNEHLLTCATVRRFLVRLSARDDPGVSPPELVSHIVNCARCRGALTLALSMAVNGAQPPTPISCEECQERLTEWIDRELEAGLAAAIQEDGAIWWHLWFCTDCAETYAMTRALAVATRANKLSPLPLISPAVFQPRLVLHSFQLSRTFLAYALPMSNPALGGVRGVETGTMLVEDVVEGYRISLTVYAQPEQNWRVAAVMTPPIAGWLVLMFGRQSFRARFDAQGSVAIGVPTVLLNEANGPDLQVTVELDKE